MQAVTPQSSAETDLENKLGFQNDTNEESEGTPPGQGREPLVTNITSIHYFHTTGYFL